MKQSGMPQDLQPDEWPDNPILRMCAIVDILRAHGPLGNVAADWLGAGVEEHVAKAEELGRALGFTGEGAGRKSGSWRRDILMARRDRLLSAALEQLGGKVAALAREIAHYQTRVPESAKLRREPDPMWSAQRRLIHAANFWGVGLPGTSVGLRARCEKETGGGGVEFLDDAAPSVHHHERKRHHGVV